ncbi:MAG: large conductance mechanosensitive channel protein MscL [Culicoidibacterales bacterium]
MRTFFKEFQEFISKGSILNLAVGVIIGGAFTAIVTSLVANIIMPLIGILLGGTDFTALVLVVGSAKLNYGLFLQAIINFILIAFVVFSGVKIIGKLKKSEQQEEQNEVTTNDLLLEIRDLIAKEKEK